MNVCIYAGLSLNKKIFQIIVMICVYQNLKVRKLCPVRYLESYNRILDLAKAEKRIPCGEQNDSLVVKRAVLRFVMSVEDSIEYLQLLDSKSKRELHSMHKMEMAVICLLHLEMRVGENILTSICQRMINRVSFPYTFTPAFLLVLLMFALSKTFM